MSSSSIETATYQRLNKSTKKANLLDITKSLASKNVQEKG